MTKPQKVTLITVVSLLLIFIIGYFIADAVITKKLEQALKNDLPETIQLDYETLKVNLWSGNVVMTDARIISKGSHTTEKNAEVALDTLLITGFGYWNYLINGNYTLESVQLRSPKLLYHQNKQIPKSAYKSSESKQFKNEVKVDWFNIQNGDIAIRDVATDSLILQTKKFTLNVMAIKMDENSFNKKIPFDYQNYNVSFNNLIYSMGEYEKIKLSSAKINHDEAVFNNLKLFTKYSKAKFDSMLTIERDHFDVTIPALVLKDASFGYEQDSIFYFKSPNVVLDAPEMKIYRNKLITDDLSRKDLYSKMLRDLNFNLTLSDVTLKNATIIYSEKVNADMPAGKISFTKMNADIKNVSNTYGTSEKTSLDIDAVFMARTPIEVKWDFDVNDVNDGFVFKAAIGKLPAPDLNPFSQPNLKVKFEGELLKTYATVSGDANTSRINMRTNYEDFKVNVLKKEGEHKNKVLSAIANLFIKKDSNNDSDAYREGSKEGIERDHTKSVFNFLWMSMRAGLISVLTGDGKK